MTKHSSQNKVTIDDLAVMVAKGFAETKADFSNRMDGFETRIDTLETKMEERFDYLDKKIDRIDSRLTNQLDYVLLHYAHKTELDQVSKRMAKLERTR
jgi:hypothetical protein